jgi:hypothetical protein
MEDLSDFSTSPLVVAQSLKKRLESLEGLLSPTITVLNARKVAAGSHSYQRAMRLAFRDLEAARAFISANRIATVNEDRILAHETLELFLDEVAATVDCVLGAAAKGMHGFEGQSGEADDVPISTGLSKSRAREAASNLRSIVRSLGAANDPAFDSFAPLPAWVRETGELFYDGALIAKLDTKRAKKQVPILNAFQDEGWAVNKVKVRESETNRSTIADRITGQIRKSCPKPPIRFCPGYEVDLGGLILWERVVAATPQNARL